MNEEGTPLSTVFERSFEITSVSQIPNKIRSKTNTVDTKDEIELAKKLPIKIVAIVIKNGKRPLQGTKLLVKIAISRSRGEEIILHPTTPAALQPKPMHMGVTSWYN